MPAFISPLSFLIACLSGWINEHQRHAIDYLTEENRVIWFVLRDGQFEELHLDPAGILRSEIFPGLWLDSGALLGGNLTQLQNVLHQGLATPEHAAFVQTLQVRK